MKRRLMLILLSIVTMVAPVTFAKTFEVEVHGMTCAFCVNSLDRRLTAMPSIAQVQISLKNNKVLLKTDGDTLDIEAIKQAIRDAGFTPVNVTARSDDGKE